MAVDGIDDKQESRHARASWWRAVDDPRKLPAWPEQAAEKGCGAGGKAVDGGGRAIRLRGPELRSRATHCAKQPCMNRVEMPLWAGLTPRHVETHLDEQRGQDLGGEGGEAGRPVDEVIPKSASRRPRAITCRSDRRLRLPGRHLGAQTRQPVSREGLYPVLKPVGLIGRPDRDRDAGRGDGPEHVRIVTAVQRGSKARRRRHDINSALAARALVKASRRSSMRSSSSIAAVLSRLFKVSC